MSAILFTSQKGANAVEYAIGSLLFFSLSLAAIESSHWLLIKQSLNHVLLDSARLAATTGAKPHLIDRLFNYHLKQLPAFHFKQAPQHWHIQRFNPPSAQHPIRYSYQSLQYLQGNRHVFENNNLHLILHYEHKPLTPLLRQFLRILAPAASTTYRHYFEQGLLLIRTEVQVTMQSDQQLRALKTWQAKKITFDSANTSLENVFSSTPFVHGNASLAYWDPTSNSALPSTQTQSSSCHNQQCCPTP